jgi:hypothetical protein
MKTVPQSPIEVFASLAKDFCIWCEAESLGPTPQRTAAAWLARLYAAALQLPDVEPETEDSKPDLPVNDLEKAKRNFAQFWGQRYRQVFDPRPDNEEVPVIGDLGDDLSGVYDDIKASLILYDRGSVVDAAWQWKFDHETHWGHHAVGALFGIHHLSVSGLA